MELIKLNDLYFGRKGIVAYIQARLIMKIVALKRVNALYEDTFAYPGPYPEGLLANLNVSCQVDQKELRNIPATGPVIVIANHPTGALDGIVLIDLLSKLRPDVKFMGNFLLNRIEPLKHFFIQVDPFDSKSDSNVSGVRESLRHLSQGGLLVIFPAGEVATWQQGLRLVKDREWPASVLKFIRRAQVPVVPVYMEASNSRLFHWAGKIHPLLRTLLLPRELMNKTGQTIPLRIASPISPKKTEELSTSAYNSYLRANVEYLKPLRGKKRPPRAARRAARRVADEIREDVCSEQLRQELEGIRASCLLFSYGSYEVFCAPSEQIPQMMLAIGTLRERTFREIGEGTKNEIDTDLFDRYYHQMFIWDAEASCLVGAYRLGFGDEIMRVYGLKGFYTYTLFRMLPPMGPIMSRTIELGRSFITKAYQRKPAPLMLLWKGILHVLLQHEQYRYLLGPVTISGGFQDVSKLIIAAHLNQFYRDSQKASYIKPRTGVDIPIRIDESLIAEIASIDLINKIIADIEQNAFSIPVLIRKYMQLHSSVLGLNTDHAFCDSLDALILLDLQQVPEETIQMLSKELTDIDVIGRFRKIHA